jgi:hypothetical protein
VPHRRKEEAGKQGPAFIAVRTVSSLHDEAPARERPCSNRGSLRAPNDTCQAFGDYVDAVQLGERTPHREGELCSGSKPCMWRQRAMHAQMHTRRQVVIPEEALRERRSPAGIITFDLKGIAAPHGHEKRRARRRRTDPSKPTTECPAKIENAKVKAPGSLDVDTFAAHGRSRGGAARM